MIEARNFARLLMSSRHKFCDMEPPQIMIENGYYACQILPTWKRGCSYKHPNKFTFLHTLFRALYGNTFLGHILHSKLKLSSNVWLKDILHKCIQREDGPPVVNS